MGVGKKKNGVNVFDLKNGSCKIKEMAEWFIAVDCKSIGYFLS